MRRDRKFNDDLGRRSLLQAFQLLGDADERVAQYRKRMTALLY
jgi:putative thioredoxin